MFVCVHRCRACDELHVCMSHWTCVRFVRAVLCDSICYSLALVNWIRSKDVNKQPFFRMFVYGVGVVHVSFYCSSQVVRCTNTFFFVPQRKLLLTNAIIVKHHMIFVSANNVRFGRNLREKMESNDYAPNSKMHIGSRTILHLSEWKRCTTIWNDVIEAIHADENE